MFISGNGIYPACSANSPSAGMATPRSQSDGCNYFSCVVLSGCNTNQSCLIMSQNGPDCGSLSCLALSGNGMQGAIPNRFPVTHPPVCPTQTIPPNCSVTWLPICPEARALVGCGNLSCLFISGNGVLQQEGPFGCLAMSCESISAGVNAQRVPQSFGCNAISCVAVSGCNAATCVVGSAGPRIPW